MKETQDKVYSEKSELLVEKYADLCRELEIDYNLPDRILDQVFDEQVNAKFELLDYIKSLEDKLKEVEVEI